MNRELAIGLTFLALLGVILAVGCLTAWLVQHRQLATHINETDDQAQERRKARLFRDLDTYVIPRSTVYKATSEGVPVSGVEPQLERAESWPLRLRR